MEFLLLVAIIVVVVLALTLHSTRHERDYHLPEEDVLRSVDAMHQYGHDQEAIWLLQEYSGHYPDSEALREKLKQYETIRQQRHRLHGQQKAH